VGSNPIRVAIFLVLLASSPLSYRDFFVNFIYSEPP